MSLSLLPKPSAVLQSPSYPPQDLEQGGSIGDGPNLLEPRDPWTPQAPGLDAGCLKNYQYQLAACYAHALKTTKNERRLLVNACYDDFQVAVDAALEAIAAAERTMDAATVGIYQPASPLILTLPVEHCQASRYQVDDSVLIDFPNRAVGADRMGVWHSARVIGWADNTRTCITWHIWYYSTGDLLTFTGDVWQPEVPDRGSGTPVTANDRADTGANAYYAFLAWSDEITTRTRQEVDVRENLNIEAYALTFPYHCNTTIGALFGESPEVPGWYIYQYQMIIPWLPMEWIDSTAGMHIDGGAFTFYPSYPFAAVVIYTSDPFESAPPDPFSLLPQDLEFTFTLRHIESGISRRYDFAGHSWVDGAGELGLLPGTQTVSRT